MTIADTIAAASSISPLPGVGEGPGVRAYPRYPAYKDSGVEWLGEIPAHWEVKRLKFIAEVRTGVAKGRDLGGREVVELPYLRVANVQDGYLDLSDVATIALGKDEIERYLLMPGDVLMNEGGDYDKLGRGYVWQGEVDRCVHQNHVFAVRLHDPSDAYWVNLVTQSAYAKQYFISRSKQSTNLASISSSNLYEWPVVLPPRREREDILAFLESETVAINALIAKAQQFIALLQEKRKALISHAVTKGLDRDAPMQDSGVAWLGEVPAHWEVKRLKHISPGQFVGVVVNPSSYVVDNGDVPFLLGSDVSEFHISLEKVRYISEGSNKLLAKSILRAGDLVTVRVGDPGVTAVIPPELDGCNCASMMFVRQGKDFLSEWLCYAMNSRIGKAQVEMVQYGAAQKQFNISHAVEFLYPVPSQQEQARIVAYLDQETANIDALIAKAAQLIELLRERRAALIAAAVTGKIDVRGMVGGV